MLTAGLVSVTFRKLTKEEIAKRMAETGLKLVEWGGDIHVPWDCPQSIADACTVTTAYGLQTAAYGSYYRLWYDSEPAESEDMPIFRQILGCTRALGAATVRLWTGQKGSADATEEECRFVANRLRQACTLAKERGVTVSLECHGGTLTDHYESALRLVEAVDHPALRLYWQPNQHRDTAYNLASLRHTLPLVSNVHVFSWEGTKMYPLADHEQIWRQYIEILASSGNDHGMLLEFMHNGLPEQLTTDGAVLQSWLR